MRSYDLIYIVKPDLESEAIAAVSERVTQRLKEQGVTLEHSEVWGKRRMAYPIKRYREGHYVFVRFSGPGDRISQIRHGLKIVEDVLRASITIAVGAIAPPRSAQVAAPAASTTPAPQPAAPTAPTTAAPQPATPQPEAPPPETPQPETPQPESPSAPGT